MRIFSLALVFLSSLSPFAKAETDIETAQQIKALINNNVLQVDATGNLVVSPGILEKLISEGLIQEEYSIMAGFCKERP